MICQLSVMVSVMILFTWLLVLITYFVAVSHCRYLQEHLLVVLSPMSSENLYKILGDCLTYKIVLFDIIKSFFAIH
jgi:hypothetical protein